MPSKSRQRRRPARPSTSPACTRIDLQFPKFTDGRAYSQAFLLRRRLRLQGRDSRHRRRAGRPAGADAAHAASTRRCCATTRTPSDAQRQFERFSAFYQGDAVTPAPLFARAAGMSAQHRQRPAQRTWTGVGDRPVRPRHRRLRRARGRMPWPCCARPPTPARRPQATSLGAEDMVITDLINTPRACRFAVFMLETGTLHAETLALLARIECSRPRICRLRSRSTARWPRRWCSSSTGEGKDAMYESIDAAQGLLRHPQAGAAGARAGRQQRLGHRPAPRAVGDARGEVPFIETRRRTAAPSSTRWPTGPGATSGTTSRSHDVPYNPLHDQFFPSIGCAPCTRAIAVGEDFRAGRWWWEDESAKECGLHVKHAEATHERPYGNRRMNAAADHRRSLLPDTRPTPTSTGWKKKPSSSCARWPPPSSALPCCSPAARTRW